jgi:hypothetical protein
LAFLFWLKILRYLTAQSDAWIRRQIMLRHTESKMLKKNFRRPPQTVYYQHNKKGSDSMETMPKSNAAATDVAIVRAAIYPPISIARVGNSRQLEDAGFLIGPEVPNQPALAQGKYKNATGALRRQAAQFNIYGYKAAGQVVGEITAANAKIEWTVQLHTLLF